MAGKKAFRNWIIERGARSMLKDIFELSWLKGKRTKIAAVTIAVLTLLLNFEVLTSANYTAIVGFLTAIGLLTAASHETGR